MSTTVYFATNRVVTDPTNAISGYQATMVAPSNPGAITYGMAFVDGVDIKTNNAGTVTQIPATQKGGFSDDMVADLSSAGRNLFIFIHGFDNTFSDAITRAAFDREWLAASGNPAADMTVIAFSWPSKGETVAFPILQADYLADQNTARHSGLHLMAFLANLEPIIKAVHQSGHRAILLAHSMGNLALESAVDNWFLHGNGQDIMFDQAILAAGDCQYDSFDQPNLGGLSGLPLLVERIATYYSNVDHVLQLSMVVNLGAQRLGQDGPLHRSDTKEFPPSKYSTVNCTKDQDYDFTLLNSHQYYRMSPTVRGVIAASI
jgi:esterase/lipase superfamily enzyme